MKATKTVWESRTIWACATALGAALMSIVNHYVGDTPLSDDALLSSFVAAVSGALGIIFRATADHKLTFLPRKGVDLGLGRLEAGGQDPPTPEAPREERSDDGNKPDVSEEVTGAE